MNDNIGLIFNITQPLSTTTNNIVSLIIITTNKNIKLIFDTTNIAQTTTNNFVLIINITNVE
jgi:hypothetical protein